MASAAARLSGDYKGSRNITSAVVDAKYTCCIILSLLLLIILISAGAQSRGPTAARRTADNIDLRGHMISRSSSRSKTQTFEPHAHHLLQSMCQHSAFPGTCIRELSPISAQLSAGGGSSSYALANMLELALQAALSRARQAHQLAASYSHNPQLQMLARQSAGDCAQFMVLTHEHLQAVASLLSGQLQLGDVKRHLSFCMSFQSACADGLEHVAVDIAAEEAQKLASDQEYLFEVIGIVLSLVDRLEGAVAVGSLLQYTSSASYTTLPNGLSNTLSSTTPRRLSTGHRRSEELQYAAVTSLTSGTDDDSDVNLAQSSSMPTASVMQGLLSYLKSTANALPQWLSPTDRRLLIQRPSSDPTIFNMADVDPAPTPAPSSDYVGDNGDDDADDKRLANAVVAQDGSGDFLTITDALNSIPSDFQGRFVVYIKAGVYPEVVTVTQDQQNVTFLGDGVESTIITGNHSVGSGLYTTVSSAIVGISGDGFFARDITFRNTAGPHGFQAVALLASADRLVFYRCNIEGFQDTLFAVSGRQFYYECQISGTVDFIFGYASAVFQNCMLLAGLPLGDQQNTCTAQGRRLASDANGFVFRNCTVAGDDTLLNSPVPLPTYLGRPWKAFSRVVFIESEMDALLHPQGWLSWNQSNPFITTLYYGEFQNRGPGSGIEGRVNWPGVHANMTLEEATQFSVENFIQGSSWIPSVLPNLAG